MQQVREYRHIHVEPIAGAIGAEISDVDLSRLDDATFAEIRQAFVNHLCVFFRHQQLTPDDLESLAARFGDPEGAGYADAAGTGTHVQILLREADHAWGDRNDGDVWHSDLTFRDRPSALAGLYSVEVPSQGGDTMFASMYAAFEALSPRLQELCETLDVMHAARGLYGPVGTGGPGHQKPMRREMYDALTPEARHELLHTETRHPLVVVHPHSGRKLLFTGGPFGVRFDGMTEDESAPLLQFLYRHAQRPEFTMRWRWEPNQVGIWDNVACMHLGVQDYAGMRREMYRFEVAGQRPVGTRPERPAPVGVA